MSDLPAFPKPSQLEEHEYLNQKQRRKALVELYYEQRGICACGCNREMLLSEGIYHPDAATLDHIKVQPMGHKKNDARSNLRAVRWDCNSDKGSRRNYDGSHRRA